MDRLPGRRVDLLGRGPACGHGDNGRKSGDKEMAAPDGNRR